MIPIIKQPTLPTQLGGPWEQPDAVLPFWRFVMVHLAHDVKISRSQGVRLVIASGKTMTLQRLILWLVMMNRTNMTRWMIMKPAIA